MTLHRLLEVPLADLTFADIEALIAEEAEEGPRLDLKRELPAKDDQADPWMRGGKKIGDPARDKLAQEIVAFANAYGGVVVVGVDETVDDPKRASRLHTALVPRVAECAERLQQSLYNFIDPPLPVLEVRGLERPDGEGEGVLVLRTGPSTRAPHGRGRPPQAYRRRGSLSEPMTMRDLQSALFETRSRGERITALLEARRDAHLTMIASGPHGVRLRGEQPFLGSAVIWFRCTLVAAEDLGLRAFELPKTGVLIRPWMDQSAFGSGSFNQHWDLRHDGIETVDHDAGHFARWFIGDRGIVDAHGLFVLETFGQCKDALAPVLFPPVVAQVLGLGELLRRQAKRPEVELVVECEFNTHGTATAMHSDGRPFDRGVQVPQGSTRIAPVTLGNMDDYPQIVAALERGIWHGLGLPISKALDFLIEEWLASLKLK